MDDLCDYYESEHSSLASLHPGIRDALTLARKRKSRTAVFTGKGRRTTEITLHKLGIEHCFDLVVSGNDVTHFKPDPEGIQRVLSTFSVAPEHAVMVGDTFGDLRASRGAGVPMAAVLWDSYDRERLAAAKPDYWFETVERFTAWLDNHLPS
jgi:pyrophosphatase PpaX